MIKKICPICKKIFYTYICRIKSGSGKHCSSKCYGISKKGFIPKSAFKKGHIESEQTRKKRIHTIKKVYNQNPWGYKKRHVPWNRNKKGIHLSPSSEFKSGKNHPNWKGGETITDGYVYIHIGKNKYKKRANLVMEKHLGRYLKPKEIVHHINKNRSDDRLFNLTLCSNKSTHMKFHKNPYGTKDRFTE